MPGDLRYNKGMKHLINRLAVSRALVRLSHALSSGWNLVALHTPSALRRQEQNRTALGSYSGEGHIQGQARRPVAALPYGNYTMSYNGCEVIAAYNALLTLGEQASLGETAAWFERRGLVLGGLWGTHVLAIPRFFAARGYAPFLLWETPRRRGEEYDAALAGARAGVFSFWNSAKRLRQGVHTVCLRRVPGGGLQIDNLGSFSTDSETRYRCVADFIRDTGILPILLVCIPDKAFPGEAGK